MNEQKEYLIKKLSLVSGKNLKELIELRESCDLAIQYELEMLAIRNGLSPQDALHMFPKTRMCRNLLKALTDPDYGRNSLSVDSFLEASSDASQSLSLESLSSTSSPSEFSANMASESSAE